MSPESASDPGFDSETETLSPSLDAFLSRASASRHQLAALPPDSNQEDQTYKVPEGQAGDCGRQGLAGDTVWGKSCAPPPQYFTSQLPKPWRPDEDWSHRKDHVEEHELYTKLRDSTMVKDSSTNLTPDRILRYGSLADTLSMRKRRGDTDPADNSQSNTWLPFVLPQFPGNASLAETTDLSKKAGDRALSYTISEDLTDPDQVRKKRLRALEDLRNRKKIGKGTPKEEESESAMEEVD